MEESSLKHPALARIFAIVLAILCLVMLLAGAGIVRAALKDRDRGLADLQRLETRIERYDEILGQLEGTERYAQVNKSLTADQEAHDEQAVQHRTDLAIYTATRSGLLTGAAQLQEAQDALTQGRAQYEAGLALFQQQEAAFYEGYAQFQEGKRQLAEGRKTLELVDQAMAGLQAQLDAMKSLSSALESEDEDARLQVTVEAYDAMLSSMDQMLGLYASLKDQGGISADQMRMLVTLLAQQTGADPEELLQGIELQDIDEETLAAWEEQIQEATGMSMEELRAQIQARRDSLAEQDAESPLTEEQFRELQAAYARDKEQIDRTVAALEEQLAGYEAQLAAARAQMDEAQAQIDQMEPYMEQGKAAIEQGRAALEMAGAQMAQGQQAIDEGFAQIREKEAELDEQAKELAEEKKDLDEQSEELTERSLTAKVQKDLEEQETSLRYLLLSRDEIQERVDSGMELQEAARDFAASLSRDTERMARGRILGAALMAAGALAGFLAIGYAFEKLRGRFWLFAPPILCALCAAGAEAVCRVLGRGDSYSALAAAVFAVVYLLVAAPRRAPRSV